MRKNLGKQPALFPMPVLMVAAYDENGTVGVMNAAWGMISGHDKIALFIDEEHKTTKNIKATKAFTVSLADRAHMDVADFMELLLAIRCQINLKNLVTMKRRVAM